MESIAEIQDMRVTELKEFLRRHEVDVSKIKRKDGKTGPPRKTDLLAAALHVRADYDNPEQDGPTSPENTNKQNIFQQGFSPKSGRRLSIEANDGDAVPMRRASDSARKQKKRRSSVGWVNPTFLSQITPKSKPSASASAAASGAVIDTPPSVPEEADESVETYANDFGDDGDQVIQSDYDSVGASSGVESDGGSVIETDDEETNENQFKMMKAYEVREWLSAHNVPFNHRSKKAELISIATAHALYLETNAGAEEKGRTAAAVKDATVDDDDEDEVQIVENPSSMKPSSTKERVRKVRSAEAASTRREDAILPATDEVVAVRSKERSSSTRRRTIKAPSPPLEVGDEDSVTPAEKEDENSSMMSSKRRRQHARHPRHAARKWPGITLPSVPTVRITKRGIVITLGVVVVSALLLSVIDMVYKANLPFCDTDSSEYFLADGQECQQCPENGECSNGKLSCKTTYKKHGRTCVEDSAISNYAISLEGTMLKFLAERKGSHMCGEVVDPTRSKTDLREIFPERSNATLTPTRKQRLKNLRLDRSKFDNAFDLAIQRMERNPHIKNEFGRFEAMDGKRNLKCIVWQFVWKNFLYVSLFVVSSFLLARWRVRRWMRKREQARVERVYEQALEVLREVRVNYADDDKGDAFMRDTELREELLGRTTDESVKLWAKVENLLRADTRVLRSGPRTIKGMPCYVYEWRGNLRRPPSIGSAARGYSGGLTASGDSKRRLSFGSGRPSGGFEIASPRSCEASSPRSYRVSPTTPRAPIQSPMPAPSPGYANLLNSWLGK